MTNFSQTPIWVFPFCYLMTTYRVISIFHTQSEYMLAAWRTQETTPCWADNFKTHLFYTFFSPLIDNLWWFNPFSHTVILTSSEICQKQMIVTTREKEVVGEGVICLLPVCPCRISIRWCKLRTKTWNILTPKSHDLLYPIRSHFDLVL